MLLFFFSECSNKEKTFCCVESQKRSITVLHKQYFELRPMLCLKLCVCTQTLKAKLDVNPILILINLQTESRFFFLHIFIHGIQYYPFQCIDYNKRSIQVDYYRVVVSLKDYFSCSYLRVKVRAFQIYTMR